MQPYGLLEACRYEDLNKHTPIFNVYALDEVIWIRIPTLLRFFKLTKIQDISGRLMKDIEFDDSTFHQEFPKPWIKVSTKALDLESGQHIYKLTFIKEFPEHPECAMTESVFISYIARDNNPKTPYIYMPNRGNPEDPYSEEYNYEEEYVTDD